MRLLLSVLLMALIGCQLTVLEYGRDDDGQSYFTTLSWDGAGSLCFDEVSGWGVIVENLGGGELVCTNEEAEED